MNLFCEWIFILQETEEKSSEKFLSSSITNNFNGWFTNCQESTVNHTNLAQSLQSNLVALMCDWKYFVRTDGTLWEQTFIPTCSKITGKLWKFLQFINDSNKFAEIRPPKTNKTRAPTLPVKVIFFTVTCDYAWPCEVTVARLRALPNILSVTRP